MIKKEIEKGNDGTLMINKLLNILFLFFIICSTTLVISSCSNLNSSSNSESTSSSSTVESSVWENSPSIGLVNGLFDGISTVEQIRKHGSHGVGAWHELDGEGVIIDGYFYKIHGDGTVEEMTNDASMAWVTISPFTQEQTLSLPAGLTFSQLPDLIDGQLPQGLNTFYAIRVDGLFSYVHTRSLPKQSKPYPPLCEVTQTQPTFTFDNVRGSLIGFRSPDFIGNMGTAGWHLHFITGDRSGGGHVLEFTLAGASELSLDQHPLAKYAIPDNNVYEHADLSHAIECESTSR